MCCFCETHRPKALLASYQLCANIAERIKADARQDPRKFKWLDTDMADFEKAGFKLRQLMAQFGKLATNFISYGIQCLCVQSSFEVELVELHLVVLARSLEKGRSRLDVAME